MIFLLSLLYCSITLQFNVIIFIQLVVLFKLNTGRNLCSIFFFFFFSLSWWCWTLYLKYTAIISIWWTPKIDLGPRFKYLVPLLLIQQVSINIFMDIVCPYKIKSLPISSFLLCLHVSFIYHQGEQHPLIKCLFGMIHM